MAHRPVALSEFYSNYPQRRFIMYIGGILGTVLVIVLILYLIRRI
jgi:nitrate reductase gamma subunit